MHEVDLAIVKLKERKNSRTAPLRWFGGKGLLAPNIIPLFPTIGITTYVEPYAGAASVFWALQHKYPIEVINDVDSRIVAVFRALQDDEKFERFAHKLLWTPYSSDEHKKANDILDNLDDYDEIDVAWAMVVAHVQGFGGRAHAGWGKSVERSQPESWRSRQSRLLAWHDRIMQVYIENRDALEVIQYWDSPTTLFYIDPPYVQEARTDVKYEHEVDDSHHHQLVETLLGAQSQHIFLSGYDTPIYKPLEDAGWRRVEWETVSHAAGRTRTSKLRGEGSAKEHARRVEVLWTNHSSSIKEQPLLL